MRRPEGRVVIELDARDDGDLARELEEGPVGLVRLDDRPLARAPRVGRRAAQSPPITKTGSRPHSSNAGAAIAAVVVLPCAPPTAIVRLRRETSPSIGRGG